MRRSLIGSDFYAQPDLPEVNSDARLKINVFDWDGADGFPDIMKSGGFDAVVGNPPYVRQETIKETKAYLAKHFESFEGTADLFTYFMERGVKLLRHGGHFGIIVSSGILRANFAKSLRRTLKKEAAARRIGDFGGQAVFRQAKGTHQLSHGNQDKIANKSEGHSRVCETAHRQMEEYNRRWCSRR